MTRRVNWVGSRKVMRQSRRDEWPILIMLGALIPVSDALRTMGGTVLIAASALPPFGAFALLLATAMAVTPFLN